VFSSRLPARIEPNAVSLAVASARASGARLLDLTDTNPTAVGLAYPDGLLAGLADSRGAAYRPDPLGLPDAREAVCRHIGEGATADRVVLTASTSEAYAMLFKLLCDPGDEVLVPKPGYPLFDLLTGLEAIRAMSYRLDRHGGWNIDRRSVESVLTPRSRAIVIVSPNNPTGSTLHDADREWLVALAAEHHMAIIADEVFAGYLFRKRLPWSSLASESRTLVFTLGGLSKSAGLPQVKLGWIQVSGPEARVPEAMARLEIIADTYLSVSTPVQVGAARLIEAGLAIREQIFSRITRNLDALRQRVAASPQLTLLEPEGGWSAVVRVPAVVPEDALVLRLLREEGVLVHPGYFFDFDEEAFLVLSLLPEASVFDRGISAIARVVAQLARDEVPHE
jgi:aspartate/methionine/tyrosine aminotransferase